MNPEAPSLSSPAEPFEQKAEAGLPNRVEGLTCPSCSGALEMVVGLRVVECPYCEKTLLATSDLGLRRWVVEPRVTLEKARELGRKWLSLGWNKDSRLTRQAEIGEAILCFLPFYRVEADCVGVALGKEKKSTDEGGEVEVEVEKTMARSFDRTFPAVNVAEWGVQRIDLRGDHLLPFDRKVLEQHGMVFPPTGSEVVVKRAALAQIKRESDPAKGLSAVKLRFLETIRERIHLIYYPLWVVRYRFRNRSYQLLVDAEDGTLAFGKAPGNDVFRAAMLVLSQFITLFIATTALQLMGRSMEAVTLIVGASVLALLWGWRRFRHGGVVIEGTGADPTVNLGDAWRSLSDANSHEAAVRGLVERIRENRR